MCEYRLQLFVTYVAELLHRTVTASLIDQDYGWGEDQVTMNGYADTEVATKSLTWFRILDTDWNKVGEIKLSDLLDATVNGGTVVLILEINVLADGDKFKFRTQEFGVAFL